MNAPTCCEISAHGTLPRRQRQRLGIATIVLALCFGWPLSQLIIFAWRSELYSYILLVPFISAYLVWTSKHLLNQETLRPSRPEAAVGLGAGAAILGLYWLARAGGWKPELQDYLTVTTAAFVCCFWGVCLAVCGRKYLSQILFPLVFLVFMVPLPKSWELGVDTFFQYTSAAAAEGYFDLAREPVFRNGLDLKLSGFALTVAPECSGIHSTVVLLMTGLLAAYLFLRRCGTRAVLVLAVVPLAILRNGFRVFVIGWLCVHVGPHMIDSPIHRRGGPVFFALSLIPFFMLLVFLRKLDTQPTIQKTSTEN